MKSPEYEPEDYSLYAESGDQPKSSSFDEDAEYKDKNPYSIKEALKFIATDFIKQKYTEIKEKISKKKEGNEKTKETPEAKEFRLKSEGLVETSEAEEIGKSVDDVFKKFAPKKLQNWMEARDFEKEISSNKVYKNREISKAEEVKAAAEVAVHGTELAEVDSLLRQLDAKFKEKERVMKLRIDLAKGDNDLIEQAKKAFEGAEEAYKDEKGKINEKRESIKIKKDHADESLRAIKEKIELDNQSLNEVLEFKVEKIKSETNYEVLNERVEELGEEVKKKEKQASELAKKINAYKETLERGKYRAEEEEGLYTKIKMLEEEFSRFSIDLEASRKTLLKISSNLGLVKGRIDAVSRVGDNLGFRIKKAASTTESVKDKKPSTTEVSGSSKPSSTSPSANEGNPNSSDSEGDSEGLPVFKKEFFNKKIRKEAESLLRVYENIRGVNSIPDSQIKTAVANLDGLKSDNPKLRKAIEQSQREMNKALGKTEEEKRRILTNPLKDILETIQI